MKSEDFNKSKEELAAELAELRSRIEALMKLEPLQRETESAWRSTLAKLEARNRQLNRVLEIANSLLIDLELESVLNKVVRTAQECLDFDRVVLSLVDPIAMKTRVVADAGLDQNAREELKKATVPMSWQGFKALLDDRYRVGKCYFIPEGNVDWERVQEPRGEPAKVPGGAGPADKNRWHAADAFFAVIELRQGQRYIVLSVDRPRDGLRPGADACQVLEIFGNLAAIAIENSLLYEQLQVELDEHDRIDCELRNAQDNLERAVIERTRALMETETKYKTIVDNVKIGIFRSSPDKVGRVIEANNKMVELFGYENKDELMSIDIIDLYDNPADRERCRLKMIQTGGIKDEPLLFRRKDGTTFWGSLTALAVVDRNRIVMYFEGIIEDITDRRQAEEALRESEEKYRLLVERASDAILVLRDGVIKYANPRLARMLGYDLAEMEGKLLTQFVHPDEIGKEVERYKKVLEGEPPEKQYGLILRHRDGRMIHTEISVGRANFEGAVADLMLIRDISDRIRTQAELEISLLKLKEMLDDTIQAIAKIVEMKDGYTAVHQEKVTRLACAIAREMGLADDKIEGIRLAGLVHDIGKISAPAEILSKPTTLTDIEYALVKMHAQVGHDILDKIKFPWPIASILLQHHERCDGSGYPNGLKGGEILIEARILGVADVVEAIVSHRPYRAAHGIETALEEITTKRGRLYDPDVVDACLRLIKEKDYSFYRPPETDA